MNPWAHSLHFLSLLLQWFGVRSLRAVEASVRQRIEQ
jgi:hypothetical protein